MQLDRQMIKEFTSKQSALEYWLFLKLTVLLHNIGTNYKHHVCQYEISLAAIRPQSKEHAMDTEIHYFVHNPKNSTFYFSATGSSFTQLQEWGWDEYKNILEIFAFKKAFTQILVILC